MWRGRSDSKNNYFQVELKTWLRPGPWEISAGLVTACVCKKSFDFPVLGGTISKSLRTCLKGTKGTKLKRIPEHSSASIHVSVSLSATASSLYPKRLWACHDSTPLNDSIFFSLLKCQCSSTYQTAEKEFAGGGGENTTAHCLLK